MRCRFRVLSLRTLEPSSASVSHKRWRFRGTTCRAKEGRIQEKAVLGFAQSVGYASTGIRIRLTEGFSSILPIRCIAHSCRTAPNCIDCMSDKSGWLARVHPCLGHRPVLPLLRRSERVRRGEAPNHTISSSKINLRYAGSGISSIAIRPSACFEYNSPQKHHP